MAVASGFATSFAVSETGGSFNCDNLSSTSTPSSVDCFRHQVRFFGSGTRIKPLVYWTKSHSLRPRCEVVSNSVVNNGEKGFKRSSLSALELLKTSAADRYSKMSSSIMVIGLNIHTTPVEMREKLSIPEAQWAQAIRELCSLNHIEEAAVLSTCNRIEIYVSALAQNRGIKEVTEWMSKYSGVPVTELCQHRFLLYNQDATQHLFEVAAGLDSLVLGEGQILAQVKQVVKNSQGVPGFGRKISELFKHAITAGKRVRTETNISSGSVSVSSAAVELALLKLPEYSSSMAHVLIVGAGKMGKLVIKHLVAKGFKKMVVVNRTEERVAAIREELKDADIIYKPFSEMLACAAQADVIFTCTASEAPLFIKESVQALPSVNSEDGGRRLFIDISVPRNVEPSVSELEGACIYNVDDLKEVVEANKEDRLRKKMEAEVIIAEEVKQFEAHKNSLETVPTLMKSIEVVTKFRESKFDIVKAGLAANSEVVSVNPVFLKAGTPSPTGFVMNMQPSEAEAGFDIRMPPTTDPQLMRKIIEEQWAPTWRNMTYEITEKGFLRDNKGRPLMTLASDSNPWWSIFNEAVTRAGGKLSKPEILASTTDARFMRRLGIPSFGFSPMKNTPILLHDHNEFLKDTVYLEGIKVYESIIKSLSSFEGSYEH